MAKGNTWCKQKMARARIVGRESARSEMMISERVTEHKARTHRAPRQPAPLFDRDNIKWVDYRPERATKRPTALEMAWYQGPDQLIRNGVVVG